MEKIKSPWKDFYGNPIYQGDVIQHPDGHSGVVTIDGNLKNKWRVIYPNGDNCALVLQVGDKGRAVNQSSAAGGTVITPDSVALKYARQIQCNMRSREFIGGDVQRLADIQVQVTAAIEEYAAIERELAAQLPTHGFSSRSAGVDTPEVAAAKNAAARQRLDNIAAHLGLVAAPEHCADPAACEAQGCANPWARCEEAAPAIAAPVEVERDAALNAIEPDSVLLDFMDNNLKMMMGWRVGIAPAGNVSVQSIIACKTTIREAIHAAIAIKHAASIKSSEVTIVPDWPFCNPGCDYEDPHGGRHDNRSRTCTCEEAKASICRQRAAIATGDKHG